MQSTDDRTARDVMDPDLLIVPGDRPAGTVLSDMRRGDHALLVSTVDDEIVGFLERDALEQAVTGSPGAEAELVGNLACPHFRTCRPGDTLTLVRDRLAATQAEVIVVVDGAGGLQGLIRADDVL